ncbi:MAG: hypothetical protein LBP59_12120, partial [Planctomycetaceae bacterium]|nr:hypothetical protein [Planctomycetaceae bacterium]
MYSTADEQGLDRNRLFVCLSANCRRDARDPLVSPVFQNRRHFRIANISPDVSSGSQAKRPHHRIAGVSPACGCTQPLVIEFFISTALLIAVDVGCSQMSFTTDFQKLKFILAPCLLYYIC